MSKNNSKYDMKSLERLRKFRNILIRDVNVFDPFNEKKYVSDVLIEKGYIKSIGKKVNVPGFDKIEDFQKDPDLKVSGDMLIINAEGNILCPAFMDIHVHLRDPGNEYEETVETGIDAALGGGITALACMPNTEPPLDNEVLIKYLIDRARILDFRIFPVAAMTKNLEGLEISEMGILGEAGAVAFSDDGKCVQDARTMYEIMKYAKQFGKLLILHEEDYSFSKPGLMHEGYYSAKLGLDGISGLSEEIIIARDVMLAKKTGARIHITHLSSKGAVELIRQAKEEGVDITCDVTPHHLYFDDSFLEGYDTNFKVNPPIRGPEDREVLIEGIKSGVIDAIASDHAPHLEQEKNTTFARAANGIIGMETLFRSAYTCLCSREKMDTMKLLNLLTAAPYKILGIKPAVIKEGQNAEIVIINTDSEAVIKKEDFRSSSSNSPFVGQKLVSEIICTVSNGRVAFFNFNRER
jgi:dihydroorotase